MTLGEILSEWRRRLDDVAAPPNWLTPEGIAYANQAEREACERAKLIHDATTPSVCSIVGLANKGTYPLHPKILEVTACAWRGRFLEGISRSQLDAERRAGNYYCYGWVDTAQRDWSVLTGTPQYFIDPQESYLTLVRIPTVAAPIKLSAYRYPLNDMVEPEDEPELAERHHFRLVDWMLHLAYLKRDTETYDPKAAAAAEARFTASFGPKVDAETRRTQRERRSNQTVMNPSW